MTQMARRALKPTSKGEAATALVTFSKEHRQVIWKKIMKLQSRLACGSNNANKTRCVSWEISMKCSIDPVRRQEGFSLVRGPLRHFEEMRDVPCGHSWASSWKRSRWLSLVGGALVGFSSSARGQESGAPRWLFIDFAHCRHSGNVGAKT